jgi:hypothetical protein
MPRSTPQGLGIPELTADLPPRSVVPIDPRSQGEHDRRLDQFRSARQLGQIGGDRCRTVPMHKPGQWLRCP